MRAGRLNEAIRVVDGMLLFAPESLLLWWELGVLQSRIGNYGAAIESFQVVLDRAQTDSMRHEAASAIQKLKGWLN